MATNTIAQLMDSSQDYIDRLEAMLADALRDLNEATGKETGYQNNYNDANKWRLALDQYLTNITTTFQLAQDAKDLLVKAKSNAESVGANLRWMVFAVEKLALFVKKTAEETDQLRRIDKKFMDQIASFNVPILTTNPPRQPQTLLKKLEDAQAKFEDAMTYWLDAITKVLDVLKIADQLRVAVVGQRTSDKKPEVTRGIVDDFQEMIKLLLDGTKSYWTPLEWSFPDSELDDPTVAGPEGIVSIPCLMVDQDVSIDLNSSPPITTNPGGKKADDSKCKNEYFLSLCEKRQSAKEWEDHWKALLEEAQQQKNEAQQQYTAIEKGLQAAKDAKKS